jgi:N-acetyl-beta-hexosaminidase
MQTAHKLVIAISLLVILSYHANSMDGNPDEKMHGFMIDAPRTTETMDYYFRLVDFCREKQINTLIFRLTDDQGSAYLFNSHPELHMCEGAFAAPELKKLIHYAQSQGIEMIPEIESFGHSLYITQTERYGFLNDGPAGYEFNALCPVSDTTLHLMMDLYSEIAAIFPSRYFHIGCDEVNWGASELSKNALKTRTKNQIWAEYVNQLNRYLKTIGKKTIMWGDVPIYEEREVLDLLDKDIVIMDQIRKQTRRK